VLFVREVPRGLHDGGGTPATPAAHTSIAGSYLHLLKNSQYVITCLGYAAYTFALGALGVWTPAFLERVRGLPRSQATVSFGAIVLITGFVGTFIGGWIGDWLLKRTKEAYLWVCGVSSIVAAPIAFIAFTHPNKTVFFTAIVIAEVLVFASTGPVNSAIVNLVSPTERATAVALSILIMHLLGDVPSPPLIGIISDATSLAKAFLIIPLAILISGIIWSYAAWRGERIAS